MDRPVHSCPCDDCRAGTGPVADHHRRLNLVLSRLDEQQRRWVAALEAQRLGYGGFHAVAAITGLHPETIRRGRDELAADLRDRPTGRVRRPGGGRPAAPQKDPTLVPDLLAVIEPETAGDPCSGDRWVRTSLRGLSAALDRRACPTTVGRLLRANRIGLRGHRKRLTGPAHADRDAQFRYIHQQRRAFVGAGNPRISIDAKKRELVGDFKNSGRRWCRRPADVNAHDFPDRAECRATPYGVYDPEFNRGHVCVGTSGNTADLAVDAVRDWWRQKGRRLYRDATGLLIEADGGGSNGSKSRVFKHRLQEFADETGLAVTVCHYPPGASKWNPIEHRLFSQITATWSGYVLSTLAVLVGLIRRATTRTGLTVTARVMPGEYPTGRRVSAAEFRAIRMTRHETCPQWNYTIHPRTGEKNTE